MANRKGMRRLAATAAMLAFGAGCGGPSQEDMAKLEQRVESKTSQTETKNAQVAAELERKITTTEGKYANMLAIEQEVKNGVETVNKSAKLLEQSNDVIRRLLEAQRASLKEQLACIEEQLEVLKRK